MGGSGSLQPAGAADGVHQAEGAEVAGEGVLRAVEGDEQTAEDGNGGALLALLKGRELATGDAGRRRDPGSPAAVPLAETAEGRADLAGDAIGARHGRTVLAGGGLKRVTSRAINGLRFSGAGKTMRKNSNGWTWSTSRMSRRW